MRKREERYDEFRFDVFNPEDYQVSFEFGFLVPNPIAELTGKQFQQWNDLVKNFPVVLKSGKIREEVEKLDKVDVKVLKTYQEKRLAHSMLCHMAALYRKYQKSHFREILSKLSHFLLFSVSCPRQTLRNFF